MSSTLEQAVGRVEELLLHPLQDPQRDASMGAAGVNMANESLEAVGMCDFSLYAADTELQAEAALQSQLHELVDEADGYCRLLYATRSLSKAIPQVKSHDQHNRMELYQNTVEMLEPVVNKMKTFMDFHNKAVDRLCQGLETLNQLYLSAKRDLFLAPNSLIMAFARTLDVLFTLDNLKNVKSAWNNDFSAYKRACSNLKKPTPEETMTQQHLYMFLANKNSIMTSLKTGLEKVNNYREVLSHILNVTVEHYENTLYLLPDEKRSLLKVMTFGIPLLDGSSPQDSKLDDKLSILKLKKLKLDKIGRILSKLPVIHLMGDMQVSPSSYMKLAPHIDESKWSGEQEGDATKPEAAQYSANSHLKEVKAQYSEYIAELAVVTPQLKVGDSPDNLLAFLIRGMRLLSEWTSIIQDQNAYKLGHPTDKYSNRDCPGDALPYEKAIRYNYRRSERTATVEIITMIKSLETSFRDLTALLGPLIRTSIHHDVQGIMHGVVQPLIQYANKKKRKEASKVLAVLFNMAADMDISVGEAPATPSGKSKKKAKKAKTFALEQGVITLPTRNCSITESQLFFMRGILGLITNLQSSSSKGGLMKEKDLTSEQMASLNEFYRMSFFYKHLLDFEGSVRACSDLSSLWFKEFYLELAKEIQFPIDMSLPWILTQHAMENPSMAEYMFFPLELYNDSASFALYQLDSQCMYDEIEAEVNLCFDQLVFEVGQHLFTHFKALATNSLLQTSNVTTTHQQLEVLMQQRSIQVLGRSIDFARLLTQSMNSLIRRNVDWIIGIFDSEDITSVLALEDMLKNARLTHSMLSQHLDLDEWDVILADRNQSTNPSSHYGRIEHKIIFELLYDFMPQFCFSSEFQEFTRTPLALAEEIERENPPKISAALMYGSRNLQHAMQAVYEVGKGRFTSEHVAAIIRLVGPQKMGALINEFCQNIGLTLHTIVKPYYESLMRGMPKEIKSPDAFYGTSGAFGYYQALLKPILQYPDLSTEVYQVFRVIGNTMALVQMIENSLDLVDVVDAILVNPFAKCKAPVRELRMPTKAEVEAAGGKLGFNIKGGAEHNSPIIISKVEPGTAADVIGLRAGDEILSCNNKAFKNPMTGASITHEAAIQYVSGGAGTPLIVQSTQPVTFVETIETEVTAVTAECGSAFFKERAMRSGPLSNPISVSGSVFKGALETLDKLLDSTNLRTTWLGKAPPNNTMNMDTSEFFRFWSAMQFSYCTPTGNNLNSQSIFGEGLQWGGLVLVYLMGQTRRFEATDYMYRILEIFDIDKKCDALGQINVEEFVKVGQYYQDLNRRVFNLFRIHFPQADSRVARHGICHPPAQYGGQGHYQPFEGEHASAFGQSDALQVAAPEGESLV